MRTGRLSISNIICVLLIIFSMIPDIGVKYATFGFTWTAYRFTVAVSVIGVIIASGRFSVIKGDPINKWILFMIVWSVYGFALLFVGKYSVFHSGFIEWLSIFNGTVVIYATRLFLHSEKNRVIAVRIIYWLLNLLLLIGFTEILTGRHWVTSAFCDPKSSIYYYTNYHQATGLMYNMNDFSAMITCLSPVLIDRRVGRARFITLAGVMAINLVNDATTCNFAIIAFLLYYFLLLRGGNASRAVALKLVFWMLLIAAVGLVILSAPAFTGRNDFLGAVARQINNAQQSTGSLYRRLTIYKDSLSAMVSTGMLGMGPSGFSRYFASHPSVSDLVNPHAMIFEVLTQYGIILGTWFVGLFVWMFLSARKQYRHAAGRQKEDALAVIAFVIVYLIASFAPSTFIGYSYQWLMIAVMCMYLSPSGSKQTKPAHPEQSESSFEPGSPA